MCNLEEQRRYITNGLSTEEVPINYGNGNEVNDFVKLLKKQLGGVKLNSEELDPAKLISIAKSIWGSVSDENGATEEGVQVGQNDGENNGSDSVSQESSLPVATPKKRKRGIVVPDREDYVRLSEEWYLHHDVEKRGLPFLLHDTKILIEMFIEAFCHLHKLNKTQRTNRLLVVGCGSGRLARVYIELAKVFGITSVVFNDLFDFHVNQTHEKIRQAYGSKVDGIATHFISGDVITIPSERLFVNDIVTSMWYVNSEIIDPSSDEATRRLRVEYYKKLRSVMHEGSLLIDDEPNPNPDNFYYYLWRATYIALSEAGLGNVMGKEQKNITLTNIPGDDGANISHVRLIRSPFDNDKERKIAGGFRPIKIIEGPLPSHTAPILSHDVIQRVFDMTGLQKVESYSDVRKIGDIIAERIARLFNSLLFSPPSESYLRKEKRTTLSAVSSSGKNGE